MESIYLEYLVHDILPNFHRKSPKLEILTFFSDPAMVHFKSQILLLYPFVDHFSSLLHRYTSVPSNDADVIARPLVSFVHAIYQDIPILARVEKYLRSIIRPVAKCAHKLGKLQCVKGTKLSWAELHNMSHRIALCSLLACPVFRVALWYAPCMACATSIRVCFDPMPWQCYSGL